MHGGSVNDIVRAVGGDGNTGDVKRLGEQQAVDRKIEELAKVTDADAAQGQCCLAGIQAVTCRVVALRQDGNLAIAQRCK